MPIGRTHRRRSDRRRDLKRLYLWIAVLALALVPAAVGVLATTRLYEGPDASVAMERSLLTTSGAADLLVREQQIEARLTAVAANTNLTRLANGILGQSERQLERQAVSAIRGSDGSIIVGACLTRIRDGRKTELAKTEKSTRQRSACASGSLFARTSAAKVGIVERSVVAGDAGTRRLLVSTRVDDGGIDEAVLAAWVDLDKLLSRTPSASGVGATAMLVDSSSSRVVAGSSARSDSEGAPAAPSARALSVYVNGILSGHEPTIDNLEKTGWVATVASLLPTSTGSRLGLIHIWPAMAPPVPPGLLIALAGLVIGALVAAMAVMRHLIRPVRELEESQAQLATMYHEARNDSLHDGLTGMGNHRAFQEQLQRQVGLSERDGVPFTLLLIDLDNLKATNDHGGHAEGDRLLTMLAERMREAFRETDALFRIGGDEFGVLMPDTEPEAASEAAGRLRHYCLRPPTGEPPTPFSGGISAIPRFSLDSDQLYRQADSALYWAKRHGRGFVEVYEPERDKLPDGRGPEGDSNAVYEIARGQFFSPVYQPLVDLRTGVVLGFEGLVRPDPNGPFPNAERLFSAAAETGRTVELDLAALETVVAGASVISGDHLVSINLSSKILEVKDFDTGWLLDTLVRHGISPSRVIVELTERDAIGDLKRLVRNVRHLGDYGVRLAADDVGAGNSGLRLLSEVPFDIVKIDLSLIQSGAQHAASWAVLRSLRDLAVRQDAIVIGEGVETPEQLRALRQLDIPIGQGYLLGRPGPNPNGAPLDLADAAGLVAADGRILQPRAPRRQTVSSATQQEAALVLPQPPMTTGPLPQPS